MKRHPLDPFALVAGAVCVVAGIVAALHQGGAIDLGLPVVVLLSLLVLGLAGAGFVLLSNRPPADQATPEGATDPAPEPVTDETAG